MHEANLILGSDLPAGAHHVRIKDDGNIVNTEGQVMATIAPWPFAPSEQAEVYEAPEPERSVEEVLQGLIGDTSWEEVFYLLEQLEPEAEPLPPATEGEQAFEAETEDEEEEVPDEESGSEESDGADEDTD